MSDDEILTIAGAGRALKARRLSAVEITRHFLDRIARYDGTVKSFVTVTEDRALAAAAEADREIGRGADRGPLHGIPIALKDVIDVAGVRTTACSKLLLDNVPGEDSTVWRKLAAAGAVLLGKTVTHEFAVGGPSFDLPFPPARNPWDATRFTGGSSSGSGAAVAAGLTPGALGSDSGGSIRTPAAHCAVVGLKPTYGLVGRAGVLPLSPSLDHVGPMTWTVEDNALLLNAIAGPDPHDPTSAPGPAADVTPEIGKSVAGLRIGYAAGFDKSAGVSEEVQSAIDGVLKTLTTLGAQVDTVELPSLEDMTDCARVILMAESFAVHERTIQARAYDYGQVVRGRLFMAGLIGTADYIHAVRLRRELAERMVEASAAYDIIVTAATSHPAPMLAEVPKFAVLKRPPLVFPFNLTGAPALAMCAGFSSGGLPLAVQLAAKPFHESVLYRVAYAYEQATAWRARRPALNDV